MAFIPNTYLDGAQRPWQKLPAAAGDYTAGEALVFSGGCLVPVSADCGSDTAAGRHYLCAAETTVAEGGALAVIAADENTVFSAPLNAADSALACGSVRTITAQGVGAAGANGCFVVLGFDGTAAGDTVRGILM